jgi:hypothetical protein
MEYKTDCNPMVPTDKCNDLIKCIQIYEDNND